MSTEVATKEENLPISADFLDEVSEHGGLGYSEKSEDSQIPILGILQDMSGEVKKKHERYIEGCEPGDLIIRTLQKVFKGEGDNAEALTFQPCGFQHVWVEWNGEPGEGAPVAQYDFEDRPADAVEVPDPQNDERKVWTMPNGNRLVDTRYHYGQIITEDGLLPVVVPFAGTNHGVSRQWTAQMKQFKMPGRDVKAPSFMRAYTMQTAFVSRGAQSWYKYKITDAGFIQDESILRAGFEMMKAVSEMKISAEVGEGDDGGSVVDDDNIPV